MLPEDLIMTHLDSLLSSSKPGSEIQHLHTIAAPRGAVGPLGLPEESKLEACVYAIVPDQTSAATMAFIRKTIAMAAVQHHQKGQDVLFAGLSHEFFAVEGDGSEDTEYHQGVARLQSENRLNEHPDAVEITVVYAACKDGRRWQSTRYLTGPKAGETRGVNMFVGPLDQFEGFNLSTSPLVRRLVGLDF